MPTIHQTFERERERERGRVGKWVGRKEDPEKERESSVPSLPIEHVKKKKLVSNNLIEEPKRERERERGEREIEKLR